MNTPPITGRELLEERNMEQSCWVKSSFSYANGCVEVGPGVDHVHVRDSKDPNGPVLTFNETEWSAFLAGVRAGEFDQVIGP